MNRYSVLVCLSLCALVVIGADKKDKEAEGNCDKKKFDEHSANAFAQFGLDELKWPETNSQLKNYCG